MLGGMGHLQRLAWEVGAPERTLRRAVSAGTLRCRRPTPRRLEIDAEERAYLRDHWELLARLRETLRTEPNVRFAAIFGSVARGDESEASDLDMAIDFDRRDRRGHLRLASKVEVVSGRRAQLLHLRDVELCAPDLLGEILVEGRVLVDRNDRWPELMRHRRQILERARDARRELLATEVKAISKFEREAAST
jgi:predicted nucleotidyltransferase